MKIPRQIQNILDEDETIENCFNLKGLDLYATDRRLLRHKGRSIRDFDYAHISSVEYSSKRYWWLIFVGIVIVAIDMFLGEEFGDGIRVAGAIVGLILIIIGFIAKSEWVELNVVGVPKPEKYDGNREDLDSLLLLIRKKQRKRETERIAGEG